MTKPQRRRETRIKQIEDMFINQGMHMKAICAVLGIKRHPRYISVADMKLKKRMIIAKKMGIKDLAIY